MRTVERWLGGSLVLVAGFVGVTARTFEVGFVVDPLGPKALPYLVAGLFLIGGIALLLFPTRDGPRGRSADPGSAAEGGEAADDEGVVHWEVVAEDERTVDDERVADDEDVRKAAGDVEKVWRPQALSILILLGYASALPILGFILSTGLATGALSRVFAGRFLKGLGVGFALGLGLFGLFTLGFGMELPVGLILGGEL